MLIMSSDVMCNSKNQSPLNSGVFYPNDLNQCYNNDYKVASNGILFDARPTLQATQEFTEVASYRSASYSSVKEEKFKFDVLLIYDPEQDYYSAQDLIAKLQPQQLRIFDFAKECPPGKSQRQFFAEALNYCKYTCLVVTRNFINNFWLKFKADMAIQDMLQNEDKFYSLIVIVMDAAVKINDIPLELQTLSPIFSSKRFFDHRLSKAFVGSPFSQPSNPPSLQQTNPSLSTPQSFHFHDSLLPPGVQRGCSGGSDTHSSQSSDSDIHSQFRRPNNPHTFNSSSSFPHQQLIHQPQELYEKQVPRNPPTYSSVSQSGLPHTSSVNPTYMPPHLISINPHCGPPHLSSMYSTCGPLPLNSINPNCGPPQSGSTYSTCGPSHMNSVNPTHQQFQSNSTFDKSNFNFSSQTYAPSNLNSMYPPCQPPSYEPSLRSAPNPNCNLDLNFSRLTPQEHSCTSKSSYQCDQQKAMEEYSAKFQRMASVTQSSNGCRIPTESDDSIMTSSLPELRENTENIENPIEDSINTEDSEISLSSEFHTIENIYDSPQPSSSSSIVPPVDSLEDIELEISVDDISLRSHPSLKSYSEKIKNDKRNTSLPDLQAPTSSSDSRRFSSIKRSFSKFKNKFHS